LNARELIQRYRAGRRRRGAAMVEAAIIAMVMVVIFACMWASVTFQNTKIRAMDDARVDAWQKSLKACTGGDSVIGDVGSQLSESGAPSIPDTSKTKELMGGQGVTDMSDFSQDSGYMTVVKTRPGMYPLVIGGMPYAMQGKMHMRCNEPTLESQKSKESIVFAAAFAAGLIVAAIATLV
jgi:hypothetical protein